jgi:hypothetical protein
LIKRTNYAVLRSRLHLLDPIYGFMVRSMEVTSWIVKVILSAE